MFERYTEPARRSIFFARYEASQFGSNQINTEHMLLGILREDKEIAGQMPVEEIRQRIENSSPPGLSKIPTSVDLPLHQELIRALEYAAEEADLLHDRHIGTEHMIVGLLRVPTCLASELLRENKVTRTFPQQRAEAARQAASDVPESSFDWQEGTVDPSVAGELRRIESLVNDGAPLLLRFEERETEMVLHRRDWTRKEALGDLINWGTTYHHWLGWVLNEAAPPRFSGYPDERWPKAQDYSGIDWGDLVQAWISINILLIQAISQLPESKLSIPCRIGVSPPIPLSKVIAEYIDHCQGGLSEILARGPSH